MNSLREKLLALPDEVRGRALLLAWAAIYLIGLGTAIYTAFADWTYDDPFITYRYALNLAHGQGFVYNPGQRVLSTTTVLMVLLLAALSYLSGNLPHWAVLIGAFSLAAGALCLWDLSRSWRTPAAGWFSLVVYPSFPLLLSTLGSEVPLYLALCLGAFALYARCRYNGTAALSALAFLARPDTALVPILLGVHFLLFRLKQEQKPFPWLAGLIFTGPSLAWVIFAWLYFGSPIPVTLLAKHNQGGMANAVGYLPKLGELAQAYLQFPFFWFLLGFALVGLVWIFWQRRGWLLLLAWPVVYLALYSLLGVNGYFWYFAPLAAGLVVLAGVGQDGLLGWLAQLAARTGPKRQPADRYRFVFSGFIPLLLCMPVGWSQVWLAWSSAQAPDPGVQLYRAAGDWLRMNTPPQARIGALEVGALGYYSNREIVDFAGLIQPDVARQLPGNTYDQSALWAFRRYQPDFILLPDHAFPLLEQGPVAENCRAARHFPGGANNVPLPITIYVCDTGE